MQKEKKYKGSLVYGQKTRQFKKIKWTKRNKKEKTKDKIGKLMRRLWHNSVLWRKIMDQKYGSEWSGCCLGVEVEHMV